MRTRGGEAAELGALRDDDLPEAARLLAGEGWRFTPRELARLLATGPGLSPAARLGGRLVALATVARHGALAWIGNVVVEPSLRGRGLGEALVRDALRRIAAAGIATTKLCSVPRATSLYLRLGFRREGEVATYAALRERPAPRPREAEPLTPGDLGELAALDARAFGADRSALLAALLRDYPDTGVAVRRGGALAGYAFLKHGGGGSEVGPLVLAEPERALAAALLDAALAWRLEGDAAGVEATVPASHPWIARLLEERGFARQDHKVLMGHGKPLPQDWRRCAALGGLEKG